MLDPVGVWRFIAGYAIAEETGEHVELYGADRRGYGIFEPGGRMMAMLEASGRVAGKSEAQWQSCTVLWLLTVGNGQWAPRSL